MIYLVTASLLIGSALIVLLATAADNTEFLAGHLSLLLVLTVIAAIGLVLLIAYQGFILVRRIRAGVFGAKLTARMFLIISLMALVPGMVVYGVSVQFLVRSIESWFDVRMESALEGGLALGRSALEHVQREVVRKSETLSRQLSELPPSLQTERLDELREALNLQETALLDENGKQLGFASTNRGSLIPPKLEQGAIWQVRAMQPWSRLEATPGGGISVYVLVPVNVVTMDQRIRLLQVIQPVPSQLALDAQQVETARQGYQELLLSRLGLKRMYGISLTMALTLALFSALSLAFVISERLAAPLRALARGTRAVARGDFTEVHTVSSRDELGMLTQSFNRMTRQLADARAAAIDSHDQLLEANAYLEGVLSGVTAGVVTLEHDLTVRLVNPAASSILDLPRDGLEGRKLSAWGAEDSGLRHFAAEITRRFAATPQHAWREQMELLMPSSSRILLVRATPLSDSETPDYVLVLDDVTQLIQAQRDAAWGEAARRMAHEIKNPLTPIQLSAERLEAKLADRLEGAARDTLTRAVATIVGQVSALKGLVDAFAQYARLPSPRIEHVDLNALVQEVLDLYAAGIPLVVELTPDLPPVAGDPSLLRQVLVNLMKNAQEALENVADPRIRVWTRFANTEIYEPPNERILLCVEDNGSGFPEALKNRMFEPYATTKPKGTGLGLPVVKKIIEEHHGEIEVCNIETGGARISVYLPVLAAGGKVS